MQAPVSSTNGLKPPSARMKFIEKHRAGLVCIGVLPTSCILSGLEKLKRWLTKPAPKDHDARVEAVCFSVKRWAGTDAATRRPMCTDRSSANSHSVRLVDKSAWHRIPMGGLRAILGVETSASGSTVRVEPGVSVGEVTAYLLARKLQLECTLEMEDATLGGLAAATGMTTHSHICGLIHDTIVAWEVVTAAGERVVATADNEHAELFKALPFSHGSLGLIVGLTLRCVPSQPYVRLRYTPFTSLADFAAQFQALVISDAPPFYLEAIIFGPDSAVLMQGALSATPDAPLNKIGKYYKPWFYTHVREALASGEREETIPMYDYLMRHDRSMCMTMETVMPFGNSAWFRYLFGWSLPPKMSLLKSSHNAETREASIRKQVYQDVALPAEKLEEAVRLVDETFGIFPLLCYPCKLYDVPGRMVRSGKGEDAAFLNLGVYGIPAEIEAGRPFKTVAAVRKLEAYIRSVRGFQHTYCDSFQTKEEFESMFDLRLHHELRARYGAEGAFVGIFEKTRPECDIWAWKKEEEGWTTN